ncbi:glycoside hydrolase family 16 protein [Pseudonocardia humida]|uniref:Glycoside hydrolase family 16 protein n=1 Tax=Pseudonocardia humida TaxID=2800819 RepID=A0ABT0ZX00_9PSEU|nr:family 16 glycosylhydrolase [Pseudonocardia humida]MCO1655270.1 glycoside hydrolase family 16 protein [Pseudonocardia humida]
MTRTELDEEFHADGLDPQIWVPYYLPHWSSRAESAANLRVHDAQLHLSIPAEHPLWCPDRHPEPLRVSCIQSGNWSGPVGSTRGPQPFAEGLTVREEQPAQWGYTPHYGHVEVRMRAVVPARSMFAFWLAGLEDVPGRAGEICVVEVFGDAVRAGSADVGTGIKQLGDPDLVQEFAAEPLPIDTTAFHTYAVDWRPDGVTFTVDDEVVRTSAQSPDYPMQLMLGLFDFPAKADPDGAEVPVPELFVSHVRGRPLG